MSGLNEQQLEVLLVQHFGAGASRAAQIARVWREGGRGSLGRDEVEALEPRGPSVAQAPSAALPGPSASVRPWSGRRLGTLLALAGAAAALWLVWRSGEVGTPPPGALVPAPDPTVAPAVAWLGQASRPVEVLRGDPPRALRSTDLRAGDRLQLAVGALEVTLRDGTRLAAEGPCAFTLGEDSGRASLALVRGRVVVSTAAEGLRVGGPGASLELPAQAEASVARVPLGGATASNEGPSGEALALRVTADGGALALERDGRRTDLAPGVGAWLVSAEFAMPEADWLDYLERETRLFGGDANAGQPLWNAGISWDDVDQIVTHLTQVDGLVASFARRLDARREPVRPLGERERVALLFRGLEILALVPRSESLELARRLWIEEPRAFTSSLVTCFAERGAFEFEREALASVEAWLDNRAAGLSGDFAERPILEACWLALRGDERCRPLLEQELEPRLEETLLGGEPFLAALTLERLGSTDAWSRLGEEVRAYLERRAAAGERLFAIQVVALLEIWVELRGMGEPPPVCELERLLTLHVLERTQEIGDVEAARRLLEDLLLE